jgi:DNA topoisomerase-1
MADFKLKTMNSVHDLTEVKLYCNGHVCKYDDINNIKKIFKAVKNHFEILDVKTKTSNQYPDLPFITSTLQQEAYSKIGMSVKRTMQIAQDLYESGLITYMRTDSHNVSEDFQKSAVKYIIDTYGQQYWESNGPKKQKVVKNAQEAHECIRPVSASRTTVKGENSKFTKDHEKLYDLIWKRTIAYFMKACTYDELELYIRDTSFVKDMYFISTFKKVKFNGYMIVYGVNNDQYDFTKYVASLKSGDVDLKCLTMQGRNTWTSPPARYNESSLIKTLENEGLGRPSTYSAIIQKLMDKQYVIKSDVKGVDKEALHLVFNPKTKVIKEEPAKVTVGAEKTRIVPTDIGVEIDKYLSETFDYILDKKFTANMEADLDRIANGDKERIKVLSSFWTPFKKDLEKYGKIAKTSRVELKTESNEFNIKGKKYIVRIARYGPVIEYDDKDGKKEYIPLKDYLKYVGKEYTDVDEKDIKLLTRIPFVVAEVNGKPIELHLGRYGLYLKYNENNIKITLRMIKDFIENGEFNVADVKKSLEYFKERQKTAKGTGPDN